MFTKKNVLLTAGVVSVLLMLVDRIGTYQLCGGYPGLCVDTLFYSSMFLLVFPFILLFSLLTYFLREEVFRGWINFAKWWVPLQILLVALTPEPNGNPLIDIVTKQTVAIFLSSLFVIISLMIIIWKSIAARRVKN